MAGSGESKALRGYMSSPPHWDLRDSTCAAGTSPGRLIAAKTRGSAQALPFGFDHPQAITSTSPPRDRSNARLAAGEASLGLDAARRHFRLGSAGGRARSRSCGNRGARRIAARRASLSPGFQRSFFFEGFLSEGRSTRTSIQELARIPATLILSKEAARGRTRPRSQPDLRTRGRDLPRNYQAARGGPARRSRTLARA